MPYESHTRTWVLHYLPRVLSLPLYRLLGRNAEFVRQHLFLRRFRVPLCDVQAPYREYTDRTSDQNSPVWRSSTITTGRCVCVDWLLGSSGYPAWSRALVLVFRHLVMIQTLSRKTPLQVSASK